MCFALRIPCAAQGLSLCYMCFFKGFEGGGGFRPFFPFDDPTGPFTRVTLPPQLSQKIIICRPIDDFLYICVMTLNEEIESGCARLVSGFLEEALMAMKEGGVSKDDLAEGMFMSRSHVYRVFSGDKLPSIEFLVMLEIVLGIKFKVYVPRETKPEIKVVSVDPIKSLEVTLKSSWNEKSAYCKRHGISMSELDKKLKGQS